MHETIGLPRTVKKMHGHIDAMVPWQKEVGVILTPWCHCRFKLLLYYMHDIWKEMNAHSSRFNFFFVCPILFSRAFCGMSWVLQYMLQ